MYSNSITLLYKETWVPKPCKYSCSFLWKLAFSSTGQCSFLAVSYPSTMNQFFYSSTKCLFEKHSLVSFLCTEIENLSTRFLSLEYLSMCKKLTKWLNVFVQNEPLIQETIKKLSTILDKGKSFFLINRACFRTNY